MSGVVVEQAPAKVNLVLQVGPRRGDGLHELCSLFASIDLADTLRIEVGDDGGDDAIECPGVEGPNLVTAAIHAYRDAIGGALPPLRVRVEKRIPVAAGLGGGSADAAAALRGANRIAGERLSDDELRGLALDLGADVPSQVAPAHAVVEGAGERVEPTTLPAMALALVAADIGLRTADVYAEADRLACTRDHLDPDGVRAIASHALEGLAAVLVNDLEPAVLTLRPELDATRHSLLENGALNARVTGSGPTVFGVFASFDQAERVAANMPGAIAVGLRGTGRRAAS